MEPSLTLLAADKEIDPFWATIILGGFALWMFLEWRRKHTAAIVLGSPPASEAPAGGAPAELPQRLEAAFRQHAEAILADAPAAARQEVLLGWRSALEREAPTYVALKAGHSGAEPIIEAEVDTYMRAYVCGLLARRGLLAKIDAQQAAYLLGRELRDRLRALGVDIDSLDATFGTGLDRALGSIVALGLADA